MAEGLCKHIPLVEKVGIHIPVSCLINRYLKKKKKKKSLITGMSWLLTENSMVKLTFKQITLICPVTA